MRWLEKFIFGFVFLITFARCSSQSPQDELWLLKQLQNNKIRMGSRFPYGHPKPYSETSYASSNGGNFGCSAYLDKSRRLIILLYWHYPSASENAFLHSAQIVSTSFEDGKEKWVFYDEAKLLKFISLSVTDKADAVKKIDRRRQLKPVENS